MEDVVVCLSVGSGQPEIGMPNLLKPEPGLRQRGKRCSPDISSCFLHAGLVITVAAPALAEYVAVSIGQQGIGFASAPIDPHIVSQWSSLLKFCEQYFVDISSYKTASEAYA
ncbi:hypothetical protein D3C75_949660 [compost metagenome]